MKPILVVVLCLAAVSAITETGKPQNDFSSRLVGGQSALAYFHPFVVALEWVLTPVHRQQFCAGTLIHPSCIITAASCLENLPIIGRLEVTCGLYELTNRTYAQTREVDGISRHSGYNGGVSANDIALLHVPEPFTYNYYVQPIRIPQPGTIPYGYASLFGWGDISTTEESNFPDTLHTVVTPIVGYSQCYQQLQGRTPLTANNVCTGPLFGGISTCTGDGGGPLTQQNDFGEYEFAGIASWGFRPCGAIGAPSVFTRVSAYNEWILNAIAEHQEHPVPV